MEVLENQLNKLYTGIRQSDDRPVHYSHVACACWSAEGTSNNHKQHVQADHRCSCYLKRRCHHVTWRHYCIREWFLVHLLRHLLKIVRTPLYCKRPCLLHTRKRPMRDKSRTSGITFVSGRIRTAYAASGGHKTIVHSMAMVQAAGTI